MSADKLKYSIGNSASTTLSSSISNSDTTAPLTSNTNFSAKSGEGMALIDEGLATEELAYATTMSGSTLTIPLANRGVEGGSPQAHINGSSVKGVLTAGLWNDLIDALTNILVKSTGLVKTSLALTSPVLNTGVSGTAVDTDGTLAGNSDTKLASQKATKTYVDAHGGQTSSAHAYRTTTQAISSGSDTLVLFDAEAWDTDSIHDNSSNTSRLTLPTSGKWLLNAQISLQASGTNARYIKIKKNGSTLISYVPKFADGTFETVLTSTVIVNVTAADYFEVTLFQNSGGSLNVQSGDGNTFFECHRLS